MSSYLDELERELETRLNEPVSGADMLQALRALAQAFEEILQHRGTLAETVKFVNALQERLLIVDDLPTEAPLGALIRRRNGTLGERATLYLGNGVGQPLTKLPVPTAV